MRDLEKKRDYDREYKKANLSKAAARAREWRIRNRGCPKYKETLLRRNLRRKFKISLEQYRSMVESQDGRCAICKIHERDLRQVGSERNSLRLVVDHCHKTGNVRGALCVKCNSGIGLLQDNSDLLEVAAIYLRSAK